MKQLIDHKPLLITENLSIGYQKNGVILKDLNLQLNAGKLTCLLGPNGCGKSTLLKVLTSGMKPLNGQVELKGQKLQNFHAKSLAKMMSMVYTENLAPGNLTSYAVVALGRFPYTGWMGRLSPVDEQVIQQAIQRTGMDALAHRHLGELSDGERQKVMITRALVQNTELMFLDEPTAHLDHPNRLEVFDMLKKLASEDQKAILLTTHDLDMALHHADVLWLVTPEGGIVSGLPEDLVLNGSLSHAFERNDIAFDYERGGLKKARLPQNKSYSVIGASPGAHWLKKALERTGYGIDARSTEKITTEAIQGEWHFNYQHQTFHTIGELIKHLKHDN